MGIYPNYKSIKGIKILDWNNGVTIYEYESKSILNNEDIIKAQNIYNSLPNKEGIEIKVYLSVWTTYGLNSTPFYEWYPIESFEELK